MAPSRDALKREHGSTVTTWFQADRLEYQARQGHDGLLWEVDEFLGDNAGLVVAEVELESADQVFAMPDWAGAEVTDELRYYNLALASKPYSQW